MICGLSSLLVFVPAPRVFRRVFLPPQQPTFLNFNSTWKQWMKSHSEDMSLQILIYLFIYLFGRVPKIASFFHCKFELNKAVTCLREYHLPPPGQLAIPRGLILTRLLDLLLKVSYHYCLLSFFFQFLFCQGKLLNKESFRRNKFFYL